LHTFLDIDCQYNRKLVLACGLITIPSRRTFDRRSKTISTDIKERISTMGYLFVVAEGLVDLSITAIDSTLLKAKGHVWHRSSMEKGEVPCSGIDTGARWWVYSHTKGWVFGYKLHITSTTGDLILPLTAYVTTANVQDNLMYVSLTTHSSSFLYSSAFSLPSALYMIADPGYDDKKLYEYIKKALGMNLACPLVCPLERYENTSKKRLDLVCFINQL
jgi:hypothetical protein